MTGPNPTAPERTAHSTHAPSVFVRIEDRDRDGRLLGNAMYRNLLSPVWWGDGRNADVGPQFTRPGYFPNEIGAA